MKIVYIPDNMQASFLVSEDNIDITEEVRMLFDTVISSMDWGSGMLSTEEMEQTLRIGVLLDVFASPNPTEKEQFLNLKAQINLSKNFEQHEWKADRDESKFGVRCLTCGRLKKNYELHGLDVYDEEEKKDVLFRIERQKQWEEEKKKQREEYEAKVKYYKERGLLP